MTDFAAIAFLSGIRVQALALAAAATGDHRRRCDRLANGISEKLAWLNTLLNTKEVPTSIADPDEYLERCCERDQLLDYARDRLADPIELEDTLETDHASDAQCHNGEWIQGRDYRLEALSDAELGGLAHLMRQMSERGFFVSAARIVHTEEFLLAA
jgi:hypothetical protein